MPLVPLCLETVGDLKGGAARNVINNALTTAINDLDDRGSDGKPRKVTITIEMVMLDGGKGPPAVDVTAKAVLPDYRTGPTIAEVKHAAGELALAFQQHNPDNPKQPVFDEMDTK